MKVDPAPELIIPSSAPDCFRCVHFKVTWEPAFPRACVLFGLKSRNLPAMEVFLSTGQHCFAFKDKGVYGADASGPDSKGSQ